MPKKSNTILRAEFLLKMGLLIGYAWFKGIKFIAYRKKATAEEQNKKYQIGRTKPGKIITNCDGYKKPSFHQLDRAWDIVILDVAGKPIWGHVKEYDILGEYWEGLGEQCKWGSTWYKEGKVSFDDCFHFQC